MTTSHELTAPSVRQCKHVGSLSLRRCHLLTSEMGLIFSALCLSCRVILRMVPEGAVVVCCPFLLGVLLDHQEGLMGCQQHVSTSQKSGQSDETAGGIGQLVGSSTRYQTFSLSCGEVSSFHSWSSPKMTCLSVLRTYTLLSPFS